LSSSLTLVLSQIVQCFLALVKYMYVTNFAPAFYGLACYIILYRKSGIGLQVISCDVMITL
jgi:hypothetical protein